LILPYGEVKKIMKKIFGMFIIMMIILIPLNAYGIEYLNGKNVNISLSEEVLDQFQIESNEELWGLSIFYVDSQDFQFIAQSFIPTIKSLTKIELYLWDVAESGELEVSIRSDLDGPNLAFTTINSDDIPGRDDKSWISIDIPDIELDIGETYYIVCEAFDSRYAWIYSGDNPYENGKMHNNQSSWTYAINHMDTCFKTYGYNDAPNLPEINGPSRGKPGETYDFSIVTTDSENHNIYYCINWGDGSDEICVGPYSSGEEITVQKSWSEKGTYAVKVKARDELGTESDWSTLEVSMPKTKSLSVFNPWFNRLIERFPILELIL
jgi:hypothetical protein